MKNLGKTSFLVLLLSAFFAGCSPTTEKKVTNTYVTNTSSNSSTTGGTTTVSGCSDGVYRDGALSCYYSNLPTFVFSGSGEAGYNYWSSAVNLPSDVSQDQFRTDSSFSVRIKPVIVDGGNSIQGRKCSQWTKTNFNKLQVKLMLSRTVDNGLSTKIVTLTANVGSYSNTARFQNLSTFPTTDPYVLSVVSVLSNHRCISYGTAPSGCPSAYYDIPVNSTAPNPTECVGFELQFATDDTYDLPN